MNHVPEPIPDPTVSRQADDPVRAAVSFMSRHETAIMVSILSLISVICFVWYLTNGLGIAYNDARSHLDIGRRVVEGLNTGIAQVGSVWLPLTHALMTLTVWNDFMWHSGLAGALWSMIAFVATGVLIARYLRELGVGALGRWVGVALFASNLNILYLQSTAMTELMLLATMTAGCYFFLVWYRRQDLLLLVLSALFIMLSTLVRYDGWFLLFFATVLLAAHVFRPGGYAKTEGTVVLFASLGGFGVLLWLLWNGLIFGDPFYFAFGPYSAHHQQDILEGAGVLPTKGEWILSAKIYLYAMAYNIGAFTLLLGLAGAAALWSDRRRSRDTRTASVLLIAPLLFNVLALYLGHSVLYIQGISGESWFNVRYGIMMLPSFAIFTGYLVDRLRVLRTSIILLLVFVTIFSFLGKDAVTIDDAVIGASQKDVSGVAGWLREHARREEGFILVSAASHDAVIFASDLPMKRFIHEGAGRYYDEAIEHPSSWARWIVTLTGSDNDTTWRQLKDHPEFTDRYRLVESYPFADIYELRPEYIDTLHTRADLPPERY